MVCEYTGQLFAPRVYFFFTMDRKYVSIWWLLILCLPHTSTTELQEIGKGLLGHSALSLSLSRFLAEI